MQFKYNNSNNKFTDEKYYHNHNHKQNYKILTFKFMLMLMLNTKLNIKNF